MSPSSARDREEVPVLIVGASLIGISCAIFLAHHGIRTLNVERHKGTAIHPRAGHFQLRTMEVLRSVGMQDAVRREAEDQYDLDFGIAAVESMAGKEIAVFIRNLNEGVETVSPSIRFFMTQQSLEPLLRERAEEMGARLLFGTEMVSFAQDADGVTAVIRDLATGGEREVRARYMIACDGHRSPVRERLGIAMRGRGLISQSITIYFRADIAASLLKGRRLGVIYVTNPQMRGFLRMDKGDRSGFIGINTVGDPAKPDTNVSADMSEARCIELVRSAVGVPDAPIEISQVVPWRCVADNAERYRESRVFLAGDAAHTMPPNGGFGGNTGVQDAHNLAWKLAMVLKGEAGEALLDTYNAERHPLGALTCEQAYSRYVRRSAPYLSVETVAPLVDEWRMEIGHKYRSSAIVSEGDDDNALHEDPFQSHARPGTRAPHRDLMRNGAPISTLDLFVKNFVLLAGPQGGAWCDAARSAGRQLGVTVDAYRIGPSGDLADPDGGFLDAYGLSPTGAVLVRPDGFVAWRAKASDAGADATLPHVLKTLLSR
jgi:2-polyprenyl-6-methoxyphenol hydroxylase-like FAD-dependent oxidoreductase